MSISRVTLKDVAAACGYTANTVSRAMRGDERLPTATRERIQAEAERLGYIPNTLAGALRSGRRNTVAVIINDVQNLHFCSLLSRMDSVFRASDYNMLILCMQSDGHLGEQMIQSALSQSVDGIAYFPNLDDGNRIGLIRRNHVPFVLMDRYANGIEADCVRCDDEAGGYQAADALLRQGHRRILFLAGPDFSSSQVERISGIRWAFRDHEVDTEQGLRIVPGDQVENAIRRNSMKELLLPVDYTAILSFRDEVSYFVLNALKELHLSVPGDLSLISFDNLNGDFPYLPRLTSVGPAGGSVSEEGARLLLERIRNPEQPARTVLLPTRVFDGGTVAPAACS